MAWSSCRLQDMKKIKGVLACCSVEDYVAVGFPWRGCWPIAQSAPWGPGPGRNRGLDFIWSLTQDLPPYLNYGDWHRTERGRVAVHVEYLTFSIMLLGLVTLAGMATQGARPFKSQESGTEPNEDGLLYMVGLPGLVTPAGMSLAVFVTPRLLHHYKVPRGVAQNQTRWHCSVEALCQRCKRIKLVSK
jgi:hypothetical protein